VIIRAMYDQCLPRVRLADGTLGVPAGALESFERPSLIPVQTYQ